MGHPYRYARPRQTPLAPASPAAGRLFRTRPRGIVATWTLLAACIVAGLLGAACTPATAPAAPTAAPTVASKPAAVPSPAAGPSAAAAPSPSVASPSAAASPIVAASPAAVASPSPAAAAPQPTAVPRTGDAKDLILATTTSTQDSGLLDVLIPLFEQQTGYSVKTVSVGTGAALALGARGEADVVLVHAPQSELQWMQQGYGTERLLVMHNDFLIVGPASDPAHIKGDASALDALHKVADAKVPFVSRGDNSGTQQLELSLWQKDAIDPKGQPWYIESGTGMGQTLVIADQRQAVTITDRATWLAFSGKIQLPIMVEKDPALLNVYHVMPVNPQKFPGVAINAAGGQAFADFMVAPSTQEVIGAFGQDTYGQALFVPDAGKPESAVGL